MIGRALHSPLLDLLDDSDLAVRGLAVQVCGLHGVPGALDRFAQMVKDAPKSADIQNIRNWLELIELDPKWSKKLLSSLIIHLSLSGVFIRDTDLFPRDITQLLNSDINPVYNLSKQLTRLFPAYFNDIGAEGRLRDISTRIDEICLRRDPLTHFLRKQRKVPREHIGYMKS